MLMLERMKRTTSGFTIIELLVTITVLVIISALIAGGTLQVQKKARDDERRADVVTIMNALEKYYETHGEYPADDAMNPSFESTQLSNFNAVKTLMPGLTDEDLTGPGGYKFYATCLNITCDNSSANWETYRTKSYVYISRFTSDQTDTTKYWIQLPASYGNNTGWGCRMETEYAKPGYVMAWRREFDGIWEFKRSKHGIVTISTYSGGPVAPQTCTFS